MKNHCKDCGLKLTVPSWTYCNEEKCAAQRQYRQFRKSYQKTVINRKLLKNRTAGVS